MIKNEIVCFQIADIYIRNSKLGNDYDDKTKQNLSCVRLHYATNAEIFVAKVRGNITK